MSSLYPSLGHSSAATIRIREPLQEFQDLLESCKRTSVIHEPHREFVLVNRMLEWFRSEYRHGPGRTNAGRVLMAVYDQSNELEVPPNLIKSLLQAMAPDDRCWLKVFIILLQQGKGIYIQHFWHYRVVDKLLPITEEELFKKISNMPLQESEQEKREFARDFFELQFQHCTKDSLDGRKLDDTVILPVCKMEPIKPEDEESGKVIKIFLIEVPCDSISQNILENIKSEPFRGGDEDEEKYHEFALKVLKDNEEYDQEAFAYDALRGSDGIVQCLGNWEIKKQSGESEYHLLLEWGNYDLDDYFENFAPPALGHAIIQFWETLSNVATALDKIHNMKNTVENRTTLYYGWHGDIKPENLVFCEGRWKIADPGFARIVSQESADFNEGLPVIELRGGTEYYGPPEQVVTPKQPVTQRFDIWSLGCVFSEAATWLLLGYRGVEQFRMVRKLMQSGDQEISLTKIEGDDCFHNGTTVSEGVLAWHNYLRHSLREKDRVTKDILDLIEDKMLIQQAKKRISSKDLVRRLKEIIHNAKKDTSLGTYKLPPYFHVAFAEEQKKRATEWSKEMGQTRKSNRHKSTRFQNSPGSVPMGFEIHPYDEPHIYTAVLPTPFSEIPSPSGDPGLYRDDSGVTQHTLGPQIQVDTNIAPQSPYGQNVEQFDYWDALHLLEGQGWVYKGTLERPQERPREAQGLISPPPSIKSVRPAQPERSRPKEVVRTTQRGAYRPAPPVSQHKSIGKSILVQKLWRRAKGVDFVFHKDTLVTPPTSSPPLTGNTIPSGMSGIDVNLKNKQLDEYFDDRDIVFLLDNGSTMERHWPRVRELVAVLVTLLHGQDDDGMDMYFTSSTAKNEKLSEPQQFVDIINRMRPKGQDPRQDEASLSDAKRADDIRKVLSHILSLVGQATYKRKLTLIILTDGVWMGIGHKRTVANKIVNSLQEWEDEDTLKEMLHNRGLSLQFVQFGDDKAATKEFDYMDNHLVKSNGERLPDIIDVEPATGNIMKMILGSLSTIWDRGGPPTVTSDEIQSRLGGPESIAASNNPAMPQELHSPDLLEQYGQSQRYFNSERDTDHSGAQFEQISPKGLGQGARQMRDQGGPSGRRRGTKDSISTGYHGLSRSG